MTRKCTVPNVRHYVRLAVKAEPFQSSPSGATVWILVCERACSVTSRALDVSRDKVFGVMFLQRVRGHVLVQQTGLPVAQKLRASSHAFLGRQNFDRTGSGV